MKTEEKAKAYDEALKKIKPLYEQAKKDDNPIWSTYEYLLPELRESEDEMIRKWLLECVENLSDGNFIEVSKRDVIFYLEKQKDHFRDDTKMVEQKPVVTHGETYHVDTLGTQQVISGKMPQKPAEWSYDNRIQYDSVKSGIEAFASTYSFNIESKLFPQLTKEQQQLWREEIEQAVIAGGEDGIELARDNRYKENRTIEWNQDDEQYLLICKNALQKYQQSNQWDANIISNWLEKRLKSLRPQPHKEIYQAAKRDLAIKFMNYLDENRPEGKMSLSNGECEDIDKAFKEGDWAKIIRYIKKYQPHWKPSEEQMEALKRYSPVHHPDVHLVSLYDDLKKLM